MKYALGCSVELLPVSVASVCYEHVDNNNNTFHTYAAEMRLSDYHENM